MRQSFLYGADEQNIHWTQLDTYYDFKSQIRHVFDQVKFQVSSSDNKFRCHYQPGETMKLAQDIWELIVIETKEYIIVQFLYITFIDKEHDGISHNVTFVKD